MRYKFNGTPFDIVPFGKNIERDGKISFPPFYETLLTVVGYSEAMSTARRITIAGREIKVATAEMLVGLKLVSWDENKARDRDAKDINYILSNYTEIDGDVELDIYDNFPELIDEFDAEMHLASLCLMGMRLNKFTDITHLKLMIAILKDEDKKNKLSRNMHDTVVSDLDDKIEMSLNQLNALLSGLERK